MKRAGKVAAAGAFAADDVVDRITLVFEDRYRRRIALKADGGLHFLLDLAEATTLRDGDGLVLDEGGVVMVKAADEALIAVSAPDAATLARLAWHLGNRHLPARIEDGRILIRDDHVIVDMLKGLGAQVAAVAAPFDPEGGAYGQQNHDPGHHHASHHHHDHDHDHHHHGHGHDHGHGHHHHHHD